jgi:hypothetical protein
MENKNIKVSFFQNVKSQNNTITTLELIFKDIKNGKWKNEIEQMRLAKYNEKDEMYSDLKIKLKCFTPSATFKDKRDKDLVLTYSGIMSIDYDGLPIKEVDDIKNIIIRNSNTYCCFISPSGKGLKVFVKIDSNKENHFIAFKQVRDYYDALVNVNSDKSCKDVGRLCFVSDDKGLFYNPDSQVFNIIEDIKQSSEVQKSKFSNQDVITKGGRNTYLTKIAGVMVSKGISENAVLAALLEENNDRCNPKLSKSEVIKIVKSIAKYNSSSKNKVQRVNIPPKSDVHKDDVEIGVIKDIIKSVMHNTEASYMSIVFSFLAAFGNIIGRDIFFSVGGGRHHTNLFTCIVGRTSRARKGTSWSITEKIFEQFNPNWLVNNVSSGLYSGEGLIHNLRDPKTEYDKKTKQDEIIDNGVSDKRFLCVEEEFSTVLNHSKNQMSILSSTLRSAWDGKPLTTIIKNNREKATKPHLSIVSHITVEELKKCISSSDLVNGFANRFLWIYSDRSKKLSNAPGMPQEDILKVSEKLKSIEYWVRGKGSDFQILFDEQSEKIWHEAYDDLSEGVDGVVGKVTGRSEPQVIRIALIYAVLDKSDFIRKEHLRAALSLWSYCMKSADFIFGNSILDDINQSVMSGLENSSNGLSKTEIHNLFNNHYTKSKIDMSLSFLKQALFVDSEIIPTNGRPRTVYFIPTT